jgi:hypothetical protein
MRHRRVRQALAERGLDIEAQFAGGFLGAFQRGVSVMRTPLWKRPSTLRRASCSATCGREP